MAAHGNSSSNAQAPRFSPALAERAGELGFTLSGLTAKGGQYNTLACGLAGDLVRNFGEVRLRVFGTSMTPAILPGDLISIEKIGLNEIAFGEIALFSRDGRLFAHRVVRRVQDSGESAETQGEASLITRGDRFRENDAPVISSELLGRVRSIERGEKQMKPAARLRGWERIIVHLLRHSDAVTNLYVRLVGLRFVGARHLSRAEARDAVPLQLTNQTQSSRGAECQV